MASLTANEEHIAGGMQVYKISGELYVNVSALYERGPRPAFGNYYHYEVDEANNLRQNTERGAQVERDLLVETDHVLRENNVSERVTSEEGDVHRGRLNPATPGQVMAVFDAKDEGVPPDPRQRGTWVYPRRIRSPRPLPHWSADAFPLLFPMLLPYGQHFYTRGIPVAASEGRKGRKRADAADDDDDIDDNGDMDRGSKPRKFVTQREFPLYHYAYRASDSPHWLRAARRLAQQFVVYNHVCTESERLQWISDKCRSMRCDEASDLFRKVVDENFAKKGWKIGKVVVLPASYPGSPRNMQRCFEDSIALVGDVGRPNYFITFTTNPSWPEIKGMLRVGERCVDQPMLVARVFHQYFSEFLNDVLKREVLGKVVGFAYNTEFQKRGLPHVHLLLCVDRSDQVLTPEDIDDVIQAYIPPPPAEGEEDGEGKMELRRLVLSHMIHRPCRNGNFPCRTKEGLCSKGFPKAYNEHTSLAANGYALLKRPNDGTAELLQDGKTVVTNRDVVPYSRYFLKKFHTHINIEHCASIECVKYIFKYVFKGYDCAIIQMMTKRNREAITEDVDVRVGGDNNPAAEPPPEADGAVHFRQHEVEGINDVADDKNLDAAAANEQEEDAAENNVVGVQVHFDDVPEEARNDGPMEIAEEVVDYDEVSWARRMRVVTAPEAVFRDCGYLMHRISHAIVRLNFHLPGEKNVYFLEGKEAAALERSRTRRSQLEAFFELNTTDPTARQYTYLDIPKHFRWDEKNCRWVRRLRKDKILSRIYTVKARFVEKFCLRMLLKYVKGPRSFEDVRTVNGHTYPSFFDACVTLGLSVADTVWEDSLAEVCAYRMPRQARQCFAAMISFGAIPDAPRLWQLFKAQMVDRDPHRSTEQLERRALRHIQRILNAAAQDLRSYGIQFEDSSESYDNEDLGRNSPSAAEERMQVERMYAELNVVVDRILDAIYKNNPASTTAQRYFFLQGAGGTGKTHVYNLIIRLLRLRGDATIAVAFTGIAATLLINGTTVHSRFRLPFQVQHDSVSTIKADSDEAETIRNAKLIVWDEACTQKRYALEAVERLLRDIAVGAHKAVPFGGHVMLLGGDWRQMLPIVEDGSNDDAVAVTIRNSQLWPLLQVLRLTQNMRTGPGEQVFASFLERLGNGEVQDRETGGLYVKMPKSCIIDTEEEIVAWLYDADSIRSVQALASRALLTVRNDDCDELNAVVLNRLNPDEEPRKYFATDVIDRDDPTCIVDLMAHDYLNFTTPPGMPPYELLLKTGAVVMLLRNVDVQAGLCNGTRMIVEKLRPITLLCRILTGTHAGEQVVLTKLPIKYVGGPHDGGVCFTRTQFPIRVSFCMTINKSQGQTFERVGIILRTPVFTHGQLYVALSRVRSLSSLRIYTTIPRRLEAFCSRHPHHVPVRNIVLKSVLRTYNFPNILNDQFYAVSRYEKYGFFGKSRKGGHGGKQIQQTTTKTTQS
uniref:ATP-dependent DNA helicase n=1 Tax=Ascaris lumbricoides TaxID=6252 RepID=A0A0M3IC53_ASCLU